MVALAVVAAAGWHFVTQIVSLWPYALGVIVAAYVVVLVAIGDEVRR